jgi:WD40 repeat protein
VLRGHRDAVGNVAFLMNDSSLATAGDDGMVKIWDVLTGRQFLSLQVCDGRIAAFAASPDGRTLVTPDGNVSPQAQLALWTAPPEAEQ